MICLALGLGILGAVAFRKARRCRGGYHGCYGRDHYGWRRHHHWGRRGLYMAFSHLDASPAQERAIIAEIDKLRERAYAAKRTVKDGRADLAAAIRGSVLDDAALGAVLGRVDGSTAEMRTAMLEALRNIHAVLDDKQRSQLADLLDQGWWRRGAGGPYRV
jgi:Spy/CpxP family protein refolding chaperone